MTYTTPTKVRVIMRKLPTSVTDSDIDTFIDRAGNYIDALLGEVFVVPFSTTPALIGDIATDLTVFFLAESLYSSQSPNMDEYQYKRYDRAVEFLTKIANGDLSIGATRKAVEQASSGFATTNDEQTFTLEEPEW